jgi:hypothetical protein
LAAASSIAGGIAAIPEIGFHRADAKVPEAAVLFERLFTNEPLSIQVYEDDAFAPSIGLAYH